jgi:hypothetical protein
MPIIGALALTVTGALVAVPAASAKEGPLSIRSVWVGDSHQKPVTALNSGQTATYHMDVDNTTGKAMKVEIEFEVFDISGPSSYSYYYTAHSINMPAGLSRFYSPSTIPAKATTDDYMARISIWPTNSASPSNDGDWASADFHIFSLNPDPLDAAIEGLQGADMCVGDFVTDGGDELVFQGIKVEHIKKGATVLAILKDLQTGQYLAAAVETLKKGSCVVALKKFPALLQVYFPGK